MGFEGKSMAWGTRFRTMPFVSKEVRGFKPLGLAEKRMGGKHL